MYASRALQSSAGRCEIGYVSQRRVHSKETSKGKGWKLTNQGDGPEFPRIAQLNRQKTRQRERNIDQADKKNTADAYLYSHRHLQLVED